MKTVFLSVDVPQARGAEGLLEIVKAIINSFGLDKLKLVGRACERGVQGVHRTRARS